MKKFGSFFTNDPEWAIKDNEQELYNQWLIAERQKLQKQIETLNPEQRMLFDFVKGKWWDPSQPRPPKRYLMEIIGDAGTKAIHILSYNIFVQN